MSNPDTRVPKILGLFNRIRGTTWDALMRDRYVTSEDKDRVMKNLDKIIQILSDAEKRSRGQIPITPASQKQRQKRLN